MIELVVQTELDKVLAMDQVASEETARELVERSASLWQKTSGTDDNVFLIKVALVHSFKTTIMDEDGKLKWQVTHIAEVRGDDGKMYPASLAKTWVEFCLRHLSMHPSSASSYKRIWEVYVQELGWPRELLLRAGKGKLAAALKIVSDMLPGRHERLEEALVGNDNKCRYCGNLCLYEEGNPPLTCEHCHSRFQPVQPLSYAQTLALLDAIKGKKEKDPSPYFGGLVEYDSDEKELRWMGWWITEDYQYELPVQAIPVIEEDEAGPGIPIAHVEEVRELWQRLVGKE